MNFFSVEKLRRRVEELEHRRYFGMEPITPFTAMPGTLDKDEVYHELPEKIEGMTFDMYDLFPGYDKYLWAEKDVALPEAKPGFRLTGLFDFGKTGGGFNDGFESLLYLNKEPYQAVDTYHNDVPLEEYAGKTVNLTFLLWTGLGGQNVEITFFHQLKKAHIGYLHLATDELFYLCRAAVQTLEILEENNGDRSYILDALEHTMLLLNWDEDKLYDTVPAALAYLKKQLAARKTDTEHTVHAVGHTHIDVAWMWRLKHTREKGQRSFTTALKLMDEFPEFRFLQSQPQLYKYIKKDNPYLYAKIKEKVANGQWETDGGMWVEADCNISSGESLTRQFVHGVKFFEEEFGKKCTFLWLPDVFGYSWALPQILKLCDIRTFITSKISWNQFNTMPEDLFRWRGIDGSEVMTYFIQVPPDNGPIDGRFSTYNGMMDARTILGSWLKFRNKDICKDVVVPYGYGDGGGGVTRDMLNSAKALQQIPGLPTLKLDPVNTFLDKALEKAQNTDHYIHTWDGELYLEYHRGTYTSQARNKKWNRYLEQKLAQTEWLSTLSKLHGGAYPKEAIFDGWETVLLHQFHDIIPGSSIHEVYADSQVNYTNADNALNAGREEVFSTLSDGKQDQYTAYHFGSFDRDDLLLLPETREGVYTADGEVLETQPTENGTLVRLPIAPASLKTFSFVPGTTEKAQENFSWDGSTLETPALTLTWNEAGRLVSVWDKGNDREVLGKEGGRLEMFEDKPMNYDAWDIDIYYTQKKDVLTIAEAPRLIENGALRAVLELKYLYNNSEIVQKVIVYRDSRRVDFVTDVEWHEKHRLLKAAFDLNIRSTRATYDIQYGHVERPTHWNTSWDYARFEVVGHKWADISEADYGAAILSNCKYGFNAKDSTLAISLLKSATSPDRTADQGHQSFTYSLLPHTGILTQSDVISESVALNLPLQYFEGASEDSGKSLVRFSVPGMYLDAVKLAEDGDGFVIRFHECLGTRKKVELTSDYGIKRFVPCNLLENPLEGAEITEGSSIATDVHPFEIKNYRVWF